MPLDDAIGDGGAGEPVGEIALLNAALEDVARCFAGHVSEHDQLIVRFRQRDGSDAARHPVRVFLSIMHRGRPRVCGLTSAGIPLCRQGSCRAAVATSTSLSSSSLESTDHGTNVSGKARYENCDDRSARWIAIYFVWLELPQQHTFPLRRDSQEIDTRQMFHV